MEWLSNQPKEINIGIAIVAIAILQIADIRVLIAGIGLLLIVVYYDKLVTAGDKTDEIKDKVKRGVMAQDMYYNSKIEQLLKDLRKYKQYNKVTFKEGIRYLRKYFQTIHTLEKENLEHFNPYFENAMLYLKQSINHFKSLAVSMPEDNFPKAIKYGDYTGTSKTNELIELVEELYNEGYHILLNLSRKYNLEWSKNPRTYTKELTLNSDRVEDFDTMYDNRWNLV